MTLVAVIAASLVFSLWLLRRVLAIGRIEGWNMALEAIHVVSKGYADADPTPLPPAFAELAQHIGAELPNLMQGYEREQAAERASRKPTQRHRRPT